MKLAQLLAELRRCNVVVVNMTLRRSSEGKPLTLHNDLHAIIDGRRHRLVTLRHLSISAQSAQNFTIRLLDRVCRRVELLRGRRFPQGPAYRFEPRLNLVRRM